MYSLAVKFSDKRPVVAYKATPLKTVAKEMLWRSRYHAILVDGNERVWGVISLRDVAKALFIIGDESVELIEAGSLGRVLENPSSQYASHPAITASVNVSLKDAVWVMASKNIGCLPIVDSNGKLMGVVDERFIIKAMPEATEKTACDIATWNPLWIEGSEDILAAAGLMLTSGIRRLVVRDEGLKLTSLNLLLKHMFKEDSLTRILNGDLKPIEEPVSKASVEPWVVDCSYSLREIASIISFEEVGAVLVKRGGDIGILTERDLLKALASEL